MAHVPPGRKTPLSAQNAQPAVPPVAKRAGACSPPRRDFAFYALRGVLRKNAGGEWPCGLLA